MDDDRSIVTSAGSPVVWLIILVFGACRSHGIDFPSRPKRRKPIICIECELEEDELRARRLTEWPSFEGFEAVFRNPGPWIAGIDFPFGQSRTFIENIGWPKTGRPISIMSRRSDERVSGTRAPMYLADDPTARISWRAASQIR